jgi:raffinose/stachyose/melibiose transport system substrate-binding protein
MTKPGSKKFLLAVASLVVVLSMLALPITPAAAGSPAEDEKITLKMAYWGESEALGLGAWLEESADMYMKDHPNIADVEILLLEGEAIYPTFLAQAAAGNPPDIQFLWGGVLGLEQAWNGNIQPISDYWTEEDLRHIYCPTRAEGYWNGKQYILPLYMDAWLMAYNKDIFKAAGLDAENPPVYWDEFVAALEKIRDAGYVGTYMGLKDGYMGGWIPSLLGMDYYASITDEHKAVIGEEKLTEKKHAYWWTLWKELLDKGLTNNDAASITIGEGQDLFLQGKVGIGMSIQPLITSWMRQMGEDKIGVMLSPKVRDALADGMADQIPVPGADIAIPTKAAHPKEAADFLKFILTSPERVNAMFKQTGAFPGSDQLDAASVTLPTDKQMYQWIQERPGYTYNYNYPGDFETTLYTLGQQLVTGQLTPEQAAQAYEDAAAKWRENNPQGVENFKIWIEKPLECPYK